MKGKRKVSGVLLIIAALIIMQLPVSEAEAATSSASDFKMEGTTLVKYRGTAKDVSIPSTVEVIAEDAFEENDTVERIVVPDSVKRIDPFAFWGCDNLKTVVFGKGLIEIGDYTFANCKGLEQITIPENIHYIGIQAFADCVNLADITIPPHTISIHETAFNGCYRLYIHCQPGSYADEYAESFYERQKEMPEYEDVPGYDPDDKPVDEGSSTKPEDSNDMPVVDFRDEGELLGSTKVVGNHAVVFIDNTSPTVLSGGEIGQPSGEETEEPPISNGVQDGSTASVPKYTIVDGRVVADQAYYKNNTLGLVKLPQGIEEIGQFSFARSSVKKVVLPEGVKTIGYGAFYHAENLQSVSLPTTLENVEPKAFVLSNWVEAFLESGTEDFLISGNTLVAYRGSGEKVNIPEGVTLIAGEAFLNHTEIKSVTLPESLLIIGEGAFEGCTNLTEVKMGTRIAKIKDRAFAGCPLEALHLPASLTEIGLKVFSDEVYQNVLYQGKVPANTYEASAQRLSNEAYRDVTEDTGAIGVTVTGIEPYFVTLEGANRGYTLEVKSAEDNTAMAYAYNRSFKAGVPADMAVYDLCFTDNSGIPITKLGKQVLTVMIPVPEELTAENVIVYTLDRNGQLERLQSARVLLDGKDAISFKTTQVSCIGICGDGTTYNAEEVLEITTIMESMSAAPGGNTGGMLTKVLVSAKWIVGMSLLFGGTVCILYKGKRSRRK